MANLVENTRYNESKKQSPLRSFSSIMKQLQQNTVQNTSDTMGKSLGDLHYSPSAYSSLFGLGKNPPAPTQDTGFPVGQPIAPTQEGLKTEPLPGGYNQFVSSETGDPWSTPSDQSTLRNLSEPLGGGQYITDPTQPGALIKSRRAIMDYKINPGAKKKILGGLPSTLYQVDHIVPLWVGGADTLQNLQVLDNITHRKKTAVQAVPLTLLANNKITLNQAKALALLWEDKESEGLPQPDNSGYVPLDVAEKYAKKWEEDVKKPSMWKFFGEAFKENMAKFGKDVPVLGEFGKGLVGGTGMVPGTEALPESGTVGEVSNFAGHLVTMITGIGLVSKGLAGAGLFGAAAKAGSTPLLKYSGTGFKALDRISTIGTKTIAAQQKIRAVKLAKLTEKIIGKATGITKWTGVGTHMYQSALSLSVFGQMGLLTREMTGQEKFTFEKNLKQASSDIIFGGILGGASRFAKGGQSPQGYVYVGGATTMWSLMQGAPIEDAVKEGIVMTALHGMGYKKGYIGARETKLNDAVYSEASRKANLHTNGAFPLATKKSEIPNVLRFDDARLKVYDDMRINYTKFQDSRPITNTEEALRFLEKMARKESDIFKANVSEEKIVAELRGITTAFNELRNQTLNPSERIQKKMMDQHSTSVKMMDQIKGSDVRQMMSTSGEALNKVPSVVISRDDVLSKKGEQYKNEIFPEGYSTTRGVGRDKEGVALNPVARTNLDDFASGRKKNDGRIYFAQNEQTVKIGRLINEESLANKKSREIENPENTLPAFMRDKVTGEFFEVGYFPQPEAIRESNVYNINKPFIDSVNNLKDIIVNSPDANSVRIELNKQIAFRDAPLDPVKAQEIFNNKDKVSTMTVDEVVSFLNPPNPMVRYTVENSSVAPIMKELKIPVLVVDINKMSPIGQGQNIKDPSVEFSVTREDFLRSKMMSDSTMKETSIQKATKIPKDTTIADFLRSKRVAPEKKVPVETTIAEFLRSKKVTPEGKKTEKKIPIETTITEFLKSKPKDKIETEVKVKKPYKRADPSKFDTENRRVDRVNEIAIKQITDPKKRGDFTRTKLTELAKEVSGNGETRQGVIDGWPKFLEKFTNKIKENSGNKSFEITEKNDLRLLKNLYTSLAKSGYRGEVIFNKSGIKLQKGGTQNVGKIDLITKEFNKKEGFPENSMSIIHVNKNNVYSGKDSVSNFNLLTNSLKSEKYLPIGITGKGIENSIFVKIEPKMIERFEKNPEKYLNEGEKLTTQEDKFLRTYLVDVLKMPKDIKDGDFIKRANLVFHRYDQYHGPEIKINLKVLEAKTIGDYSEFGITKDKFENPNNKETEASVKSLNEGKIEDGAILMGENAFNKFIEGLNYNPVEHRGSVKALIDSTVNGEKTYHKGQFTKVDPAIKEHYKEVYGIELGPNDVISFDTNAKIGPKGGEFEINLSDIYAKSRSTAESVSKESPSYERKFISTDVGVKSKLTKVNAQIEELNQFNKEVSETSSKTELENVFNKYAEKYPKIKNPEMLFQGVKGESFNLGAAKNTLSFEINSVQKNLLMEEIITPVYKNSTMLTLVAPIKNNYDGVKSKRRYPNNKEVVLGEEQIKELGIKEGDFVVLHRDPSYDINNIAIRRVVNGTKLGNTSLGKENVAVSPLTERAILQGDQDADALHITRIGKGGISRSEVNAILKRGNLITPFTEVKPSGTGYVTNSSIKEKIQDQLRGDDQTSWISTQSRIQDEVFDNKITIKFTPSGKGSKYNILANGKVVDSGFAESLSLKESVEITPKWGLKERQIIFQAQREAVDSKKSKDISERTKDDPNWALKQLWETNKGEISDPMANAINKTLISIQTPYNLKKIAEVKKSTIDSIKKELEPTFDYYNNLKKAGVELTPFQEKILALSKVQSYAPTQEIIIAADKAGGEAVKEQIKDVDYNNNVALKELIAKHKPVKELYQRDRPKGNIEIKKFNEWFDKQVEDGKYTQKDLDAISYWAAASRVANVSHWGDVTKTEPRYIRRHFELINASPRIAEVYYEGAATYSAKEESPITESTKNVVEIIKKKDNKPDGQGGLISDVGSSLSNAWGGVKKSLGMGPVVYTAPGPGIDTTPLPSIDFTRLREAIKLNETNPGVVKDQYSFYQPSGNLKYGNANGAYQVTDAELNERSKQFTGKLITPKEFLGNSKLQDQYMDGKFRYLKSKGFTKEDILAGHRGGWSDTSPEARSKRLLERKGYVESGMNFYDSLPASKGY